MPQRIVKQPNGLYAIWSTVVDDFVLIDATRKEIVDHFWEHHSRRDIEDRVNRIADQLDAVGMPYGQFTQTFEECVAEIKERHGQDAETLQICRESGLIT